MPHPTKRTAFVSGSGKNIGRAIALRLAKDGFNVFVNGSTDRLACNAIADECRSLGVNASVVMADVGKPDDINDMAYKIINESGGIDVLVANAAIRPSAPFLDIDENDWNRVMAVNLGQAFWLSRAFLPGMIQKGWGRIINFAGMNAIHGYSGRAHVSVSKHGVWGLTKSLAKEFAPHGITANVISPGPIQSDHDDPDMTDHINAMKARVPMKRLGTPDEVSATVALLASDDGAFINGQLIQVNGGTET
jgi:3-oxoacyl-[acyl-carrier protein] reductase